MFSGSSSLYALFTYFSRVRSQSNSTVTIISSPFESGRHFLALSGNTSRSVAVASAGCSDFLMKQVRGFARLMVLKMQFMMTLEKD